MIILNYGLSTLGKRNIKNNLTPSSERKISFGICTECPTYKPDKNDQGGSSELDLCTDYVDINSKSKYLKNQDKDPVNNKLIRVIHKMSEKRMRNLKPEKRKEKIVDLIGKISPEIPESVNNVLGEFAKIIYCLPEPPENDRNEVYDLIFGKIDKKDPKGANNVLKELISDIPLLHGDKDVRFDNILNKLADFDDAESSNSVLEKLAANLDMLPENKRKDYFYKISGKISDLHPESANMVRRELVTRIPLFVSKDKRGEAYNKDQIDACNNILDGVKWEDPKSANGVLEKLASDTHYLQFDKILPHVNKTRKENSKGANRVCLAIARNLDIITDKGKQNETFKSLLKTINPKKDAEGAYGAYLELASKISILGPRYKFGAFKAVLKYVQNAERVEYKEQAENIKSLKNKKQRKKENMLHEDINFGALEVYSELDSASDSIPLEFKNDAKKLLVEAREKRKEILLSNINKLKEAGSEA